MTLRRHAALATAGAALLLAAPLVAAAAAKPKVSIAVSSMKVLDNDTRLVSFKATSKQPLKSYAWSFGDPSSGAKNRSTAALPTHVFAAHRSYTVTVTVTTRAGARATATYKLTL